MKLVVISHKETWRSDQSPTSFATVGGFPYQMQVLSELFDNTVLIILKRKSPSPDGLIALKGKNLEVNALPEPHGQDIRRKIALLGWLPRYLPVLWKQVREADAVHTPIPGDIGTIGLLIALIQRKPLFVRHCGTWGNRTTLADRFLDWLLPRIAGGKNVVMATGGGDEPPCPQNSEIEWIFSTTLTEAEWRTLPQAKPWQLGESLRLVNVGRLSVDKNVDALIRTLPMIQERYPEVHLDILGDGDEMLNLKTLVHELSLSSKVSFHGNVSHQNVIKMVSHAHVFVFPSHKEGFPKAVLEAMACGLPVIATRVSVIPHLIEQGAGIVLDQFDPQTIANAIIDATSYPKRLASMGVRARESSKNYTLENWQRLIRERLESAWVDLKCMK